MIELKFRVPYVIYGWDENYEDMDVDISDKDRDRYTTGLFDNPNFLDNLANYADPDDPKMKACVPMHFDNTDDFLEMSVFVDSTVVTDTDIDKIKDYISGQISDGWGEGGFELPDNLCMSLDWSNVAYIGHDFVEDGYWHSFVKDFNARHAKITEEAFNKWFFDKYPDAKERLNATETKSANHWESLAQTLRKCVDTLKEVCEELEKEGKKQNS